MTDNYVKGLDVSMVQGKVDYHAVAASGVQLSHNLSEFQTYLDPPFLPGVLQRYMTGNLCPLCSLHTSWLATTSGPLANP